MALARGGEIKEVLPKVVEALQEYIAVVRAGLLREVDLLLVDDGGSGL